MIVFSFIVASLVNPAQSQEISLEQKKHNQWLVEQFGQKHQDLIPKVAVADMFYGCNKKLKTDPVPYQLADLINKMPRGMLAEKLATCLGGKSPQSDKAINFGLVGCFSDQLSSLPKLEFNEKMTLVKQAINRLSREERQKSFTKCVTKQAIKYLN